MIDWIQAHVIHLGVGTFMLIAMPLAKKFMPTLARKYADIFLQAAINPDINDPEDKADVVIILKASMRIAARRMASKPGQEKMAWVVEYVCARTKLNRVDVQAIAQGVYNSIKDELAEHGAI